MPDSVSDSQTLAVEIKAMAMSLGFDLVGITNAQPSQHGDYLRQWLDDGKAGEMTYLTDRVDERTNPATYFPPARSAICVAMSYYFPLETPPTDKTNGRVARYALGDDYHELIKYRLFDLADWLRERVPGSLTRCGVDTVPVLERELAARAGIGWIGKNACVIHPSAGSWLLLGEVFTSLELPIDEPETDHCGTCTRCIEACPTQAITAPREIDPRRCISYLTIEHRKGEIDSELGPLIGDWLYGCDVCQDVCPFNREPLVGREPALKPRINTGTLDVDEVLAWDVSDYTRNLKNSAMKRIRLPVLQRNAQIVKENKIRGMVS